MATAQTPPPRGGPPGATADVAPPRSDRSPWNWLLLIGVVVPLIVPIYNSRTPEVFGWPLFYWLQMAFIGLGVLVTVVVYRATRRSRTERDAAERAIQRDATRSRGRDGLVAPDEEA